MKDGKPKAAAPLVIPEGWGGPAERLREWEDAALEAAGFERKEETELWAKGGVYFGREAALQYCQQSERTA
jgi:hypothetical protein